MKHLLISVALIFVATLSYAQEYNENVSIKRQIHNQGTTVVKKSTVSQPQSETTTYIYINNVWLPGITADMIPQKNVESLELRKDQYGNDALFYTVPTETYKALKVRSNAMYPNSWDRKDYTVEFPGGKDKLDEWITANMRIPSEVETIERVTVKIKVQPDGTISDMKVSEPSKIEAVNTEALRLAAMLPNLEVKYYTPARVAVNYYLPLKFKNPDCTFIK